MARLCNTHQDVRMRVGPKAIVGAPGVKTGDAVCFITEELGMLKCERFPEMNYT